MSHAHGLVTSPSSDRGLGAGIGTSEGCICNAWGSEEDAGAFSECKKINVALWQSNIAKGNPITCTNDIYIYVYIYIFDNRIVQTIIINR